MSHGDEHLEEDSLCALGRFPGVLQTNPEENLMEGKPKKGNFTEATMATKHDENGDRDIYGPELEVLHYRGLGSLGYSRSII